MSIRTALPLANHFSFYLFIVLDDSLDSLAGKPIPF